MSLYSQRGVSAQKEDVHQAIKNLSKGLFPYAFCKIDYDYTTGNPHYTNIMHADGAGTKAVLAYLYWKETGDASVWKGIARDAIVMNLDDLLCVGVYTNILFSSSIDRNKNLISGEVLQSIIEGTQEFFDELNKQGISIHYLGGETADVGDVVKTITVNGTMMARWAFNKLITNEKINANQVIVGFSSEGQATYESSYNSGIGSNGLTSARHDLLEKHYAYSYPESFDSTLSNKVVYIGKHRLTDTVSFQNKNFSIAQLLLSTTRTYAPLMKVLLEECFPDIYGVIHCSGGGQTKCMKYLPMPLKIVKDNLFEPPVVFQMIQQNSHANNQEMYQVFNMGHRLEIFTNEQAAYRMIDIANTFNINARIIGHTELSNQKELHLKTKSGWVSY
jgi:phosphoribosylformylglycinamidine cyclo-ligase